MNPMRDAKMWLLLSMVASSYNAGFANAGFTATGSAAKAHVRISGRAAFSLAEQASAERSRAESDIAPLVRSLTSEKRAEIVAYFESLTAPPPAVPSRTSSSATWAQPWSRE
jgi:hypothetical protein